MLKQVADMHGTGLLPQDSAPRHDEMHASRGSVVQSTYLINSARSVVWVPQFCACAFDLAVGGVDGFVQDHDEGPCGLRIAVCSLSD